MNSHSLSFEWFGRGREGIREIIVREGRKLRKREGREMQGKKVLVKGRVKVRIV